ncbi:hypothetical protein [uncultured Aquimarina sp.]|uniref:hypothetical protein n=1 Tax=uncultured Aquimarina sp. TaxID=575652 RepID=UPI0026169AB6|nr:hypothetical protein [uncultured Aquimarina sp.]
MKIIKIITTLLIAFTLTGISAQTVKTKTTKTYNFKKDGKTIPYRVTVYKTAKSKTVLNKADKDKVNQEIKVSDKEITKLIYVDNDIYDDYDKYIVLRYTKEADDSFELIPTDKGFKVVVDNKNVEYIIGEGVYFVNNIDKDYFFVDEFDSI